MKFIIYLLIINISIGLLNGFTSDNLRVTLPNNSKMIGRYSRAFTGKSIRTFLGIPFAQPPIGDLRFANPVPAEPWIGEKRMINKSPGCMQRSPYLRETEIHGDEDCLYLNVFTPESADATNPAIPVMVFFHGGGWMEGSKDDLPVSFLLNHTVILVVPNYRLGTLGFLSTQTEDCPGNFGLKDNVLALEWVQQNIHAFGGDRSRVTIFGMSVGASIVAYLMQSPLSAGLFHGAISESGNNLNYWSQPAYDGVAQERAKKVGADLNCPLVNGNWQEMIICLRKQSALALTRVIYDFFIWDFDPEIPFTPVIEPNLPGAFITELPRNTMKSNYDRNIPYIIGMNLNEGLLKTAPIFTIDGLYDDIKADYKRLFPIIFYYDHHPAEIKLGITNKILDFYFGNSLEPTFNADNLTNLYTDAGYLAGLHELVRNRVRVNNDEMADDKTSAAAPTYVYLYQHRGAASFTEIFVPEESRETYFGICHADELRTLFPTEDLFISAMPTELDNQMIRNMIFMWTNFAKTGNPTPPETVAKNDYLKMWNPVTCSDDMPDAINYLQIGNFGRYDDGEQLQMKNDGLMEERAAFWNNLKPWLNNDENNDI